MRVVLTEPNCVFESNEKFSPVALIDVTRLMDSRSPSVLSPAVTIVSSGRIGIDVSVPAPVGVHSGFGVGSPESAPLASLVSLAALAPLTGAGLARACAACPNCPATELPDTSPADDTGPGDSATAVVDDSSVAAATSAEEAGFGESVLLDDSVAFGD